MPATIMAIALKSKSDIAQPRDAGKRNAFISCSNTNSSLTGRYHNNASLPIHGPIPRLLPVYIYCAYFFQFRPVTVILHTLPHFTSTHLRLGNMYCLTRHHESPQNKESSHGMKLQRGPLKPNSHRNILQNPTLTDPITHQRSNGQ